jgi:hypothetical protein
MTNEYDLKEGLEVRDNVDADAIIPARFRMSRTDQLARAALSTETRVPERRGAGISCGRNASMRFLRDMRPGDQASGVARSWPKLCPDLLQEHLQHQPAHPECAEAVGRTRRRTSLRARSGEIRRFADRRAFAKPLPDFMGAGGGLYRDQERNLSRGPEQEWDMRSAVKGRAGTVLFSRPGIPTPKSSGPVGIASSANEIIRATFTDRIVDAVAAFTRRAAAGGVQGTSAAGSP